LAQAPSQTGFYRQAVEHDHALEQALIAFIKDHTEFYKQFKDNEDFRRFVSNLSFMSTYQPPAAPDTN
jgi:hypothetical protein